jgi:hypothetical protein
LFIKDTNHNLTPTTTSLSPPPFESQEINKLEEESSQLNETEDDKFLENPTAPVVAYFHPFYLGEIIIGFYYYH